MYFKGSQVTMSMKIVFIQAKSADPDKIMCSTSFHQCLPCLPKHPVKRSSIIRVFPV